MNSSRGERSLGDGLQRYFAENGFSEGSYSDRWVRVWMGPIPIFFPNSPARKRAIPFHDLHHVLTGYPTTFLGEAEIGAWELASGCRDYYAAWLLNLLAVVLGFVLGPRRVARAFARGRTTKNLYGRELSEGLLERELDDVRKELGLI